MIDLTTVSSIAFRAIKANKMRSILTSLGIIIGVGAVIVMLSIGHGAQISIQNEMKTMGSNLLIVRSGVATSSGARGGHGSQPTMKKSDGDAIQAKLDKIRLAAPVLEETAQIVHGNANWSTQITGTDRRHFRLKTGIWPMAGCLTTVTLKMPPKWRFWGRLWLMNCSETWIPCVKISA